MSLCFFFQNAFISWYEMFAWNRVSWFLTLDRNKHVIQNQPWQIYSSIPLELPLTPVLATT